jgi:hypothetical protein
MVVDVELHCFGVRMENGRFSDLTFSMKLRSKFVWLGREPASIAIEAEELRRS